MPSSHELISICDRSTLLHLPGLPITLDQERRIMTATNPNQALGTISGPVPAIINTALSHAETNGNLRLLVVRLVQSIIVGVVPGPA